MSKHTRHLYISIPLQTLYQLLNLLRNKAQTVHSRIELYVDRISRRTITLHHTLKVAQRVEAIYLWLKPVCNHLVEATRIGIEHHNRHSDTLLTQDNTLVGKCHSEVVHTQSLQQLSHLHITRTIAMSLHHRHQTVVHRQELTEITYIVGHRIKVHLQHRSVATTLQMMTYTLKLMLAVALQKYCSVLYILLL